MKQSASSASYTTHPKYDLFRRLGSPHNFLSRNSSTEGDLKLSDHYPQSQTSFAHHSMKSLISLCEEFDPAEIFDFSCEGISAEEVDKVERFYQRITEERLACRCNNAENYQKKLDIDEAPNLRELRDYKGAVDVMRYVKLMNERTALRGLFYNPSLDMPTTRTVLSRNQNYFRYMGLEDGKYELPLSHFSKLLGDEKMDLDQNIIVGELISDPRQAVHRMGLYRNEDANRASRIDRVDELTALALKKSFSAENEDDALKCAFIFSALRGYNIRSTTGACWAQEMSLRWIFAKKDLPQFQKMPGVYLDVEACILKDGESGLEPIIERQVEEYKASLNPENAIGAESLFDHPTPQKESEFIRYLIETKQYREEDLPAIISYKTSNPELPTALDILASRGDGDFFESLKNRLETDLEFKQMVVRQEINWASVEARANLYGDPQVPEKIQAAQESSSPAIKLSDRSRLKGNSQEPVFQLPPKDR